MTRGNWPVFPAGRVRGKVKNPAHDGKVNASSGNLNVPLDSRVHGNGVFMETRCLLSATGFYPFSRAIRDM